MRCDISFRIFQVFELLLNNSLVGFSLPRSPWTQSERIWMDIWGRLTTFRILIFFNGTSFFKFQYWCSLLFWVSLGIKRILFHYALIIWFWVILRAHELLRCRLKVSVAISTFCQEIRDMVVIFKQFFWYLFALYFCYLLSLFTKFCVKLS